MSVKFAYDLSMDPPAPVLPVRVGAPGGRWTAAASAIVDTGADMSVIPAVLPKELTLAPAGQITVQGATGARTRVFVYTAELEVAGIRLSVPVAALGRETIIGRDVINLWTLILKGQERSLELEEGRPSSGGG